MKEELEAQIKGVLTELGITDIPVVLEHPAELAHGDWATNAAMVSAKKAGKNPRMLAEEIKAKLDGQKDEYVEAIEIAGPGFINIRLTAKYFSRALTEALNEGESFGHNKNLAGKKVIVEYTDPNPFKEFHIGHMMSNTIGESISRLIEASGAETKRACYQGDVGLHVAKAIYGLQKLQSKDLGQAYSYGAKAYDENEEAKADIVELNKKIYLHSQDISALYDEGKKKSLDEFEAVYKRLGTHHAGDKAFDFYFFESATGEFGKKVVEEHPNIFVKSDGAVVYKGDETMGLHTRVFINKDGLPTYEAKELGLAKIKHETYPYDASIVITGNEVNDYFKVLLDAMGKVFPALAQKTTHLSHGMMRLPSGKMSSRTGDVITAESLLDEVKKSAREKITNDNISADEKDEIAEQVTIGAIKYSILKQASGKDIVFDFEQALSFEGDSGPYLQYTYARTASLRTKAGEKKVAPETMMDPATPLHQLLLRFPEIVERARQENAPHHVANYCVDIARTFNSYYGNTQILDGAPDEGYKLALVTLTGVVLKNGLWLLGIPAPRRM